MKANFSLEVPDKSMKVKDLNIFGKIPSYSIDREIGPSLEFIQQCRKNTPKNYIMSTLSPSITLLQTNKLMPRSKDKKGKIKVNNFYRAFAENRKRSDLYFKHCNLKNSRARSTFEEDMIKD